MELTLLRLPSLGAAATKERVVMYCHDAHDCRCDCHGRLAPPLRPGRGAAARRWQGPMRRAHEERGQAPDGSQAGQHQRQRHSLLESRYREPSGHAVNGEAFQGRMERRRKRNR